MLDHIHQRLHVGLPDETTLPNGQKFDLLSLALLGVPQEINELHHVTARLQELKIDSNDYICLKFLLLLNPGKSLNLLFILISFIFRYHRGAWIVELQASPRGTRADQTITARVLSQRSPTNSGMSSNNTDPKREFNRLTGYLLYVQDKFNQLLGLVPEIRALTVRGEEYLYYKHINGLAPTQTLLMEMLHAKKK